MAKKPLKIDMIAGSQLRDSQGETLSVEGADISDLEAGRGRINDNHGKGFFNSIGRVTNAKKIFKKDDCSSPRHEYYWEKVKAPYIYVEAELYDDEDHPNAKAAAAILRNIHKTDSPLQLKASVEGGVVSRGIKDPSFLARTKIHSVAITFTPANNATLVEPISLDKSNINEEADMLLIKSVMHLAETNVPSFRHIARDASAAKVQNNLFKVAELMKELGIDTNIDIPTKQFILEKALESKIKNNVSKIHELIKTASEEKHIKDCSCGKKVTTKNAVFIGTQKLPKEVGPNLDLYNCPKCNTTHSIPVENNEQEDDVSKSIKNALAGAALTAGVALTPQKAISPTVPKEELRTPAVAKPNKPTKTHEEVYRDVASTHPLLGAIAEAESSGGKNIDHQTVTSGLNKGHTAGGMFGMMPKTAAFAIKKDLELAKKYPDLVEAASDIDKNHKIFTDKFNNDPEAAADFAKSVFNYNKKRTKDKAMLVHSWLNGLKGSWNKYKDEGSSAISDHWYVKKILDLYNAKKPKQKQQLKKALMAGYGGAGAPTSQVGGSVIQSESLDQGRPSFKYISCDNCGDEQIHSKYQVRCRKCGSSFSMEKLYNVLKGTNK